MCLVHMAISNLCLQEVSTLLVFVYMTTNCCLNSRCLLKGKINVCLDIVVQTTHLYFIASWKSDKRTFSTKCSKATKQLFSARTSDMSFSRKRSFQLDKQFIVPELDSRNAMEFWPGAVFIRSIRKITEGYSSGISPKSRVLRRK